MKTTIETLLAEGWREYPDQFKKHARCFYKQHETPTRCHGNDDKAGVQICIAVSQFDRMEESYEIDLCAELADETWIKLHQWAIRMPIKDGLKLIPRMLATWEHVANFANPPRPCAETGLERAATAPGTIDQRKGDA